MLYYPKIHPDNYLIERNCHECGEEFTADRRNDDDVICADCKQKFENERKQDEN